MKKLIKIGFLLFIVAITTAVSCPGPKPEPPEPPDPVVVKSAERILFESSTNIGLYIKGSCVLEYDDDLFQQAYSSARKTYRIQTDDQNKYMHINYTESIPSEVDQETVCRITYRLAEEEETMLIVKFIVLKVSDGNLWLWNELQKTGVVIPQQSV